MIRSTIWQTCVSYESGSCSIGGDITFKRAMSRAMTDATYYAGIGRRNVSIQLEEHCGNCRGCGQVSIVKRGRKVVVDCPECKGKPIASTLGPIPFVLHENIPVQPID